MQYIGPVRSVTKLVSPQREFDVLFWGNFILSAIFYTYDMVECPVCDVEFDIAKRGPVCPNGHPHPNGPGPSGGNDPDPFACSNCGSTAVEEDDSFCPNCGSELNEDVDEGPKLNRVILESDGGEVTAEDGEAVGAALRNAAVNGGVSKDKARKIHREHVKFDIGDDGVVMEVLGVNPTVHETNELSQGDRVDIEEGDTVEFSRTLEATLKFE